VRFGDVVDQFQNDDRLTDACTTERAGFSALDERADQIDDLDAGLEYLGARVLFRQRGSRTVNRILLVEKDRTFAVDGIPRDVEDASEDAIANRDGDRRACIHNGHTADKSFGRRHGNRTCDTSAEMLLNLQREKFLPTSGRELDRERLINGRDGVLRKLHVDHGADDLDDFAGVHLERKSKMRGD
jgi:hypothetical protein